MNNNEVRNNPLAAWLSGWASVSDWRTFTDMYLIYN